MKLDTSIIIEPFMDELNPEMVEVTVLSRGRFVVEMQTEMKDVATGDRFDTTMNGSLRSSCICKQGEAFDRVTEIILSHLNRVTEKGD